MIFILNFKRNKFEVFISLIDNIDNSPNKHANYIQYIKKGLIELSREESNPELKKIIYDRF